MIVKDEHELHRRRRGRNLALGGALALFVLVVFAVTLVKLADGQMLQAY
jgi:hypothetical protein